MIVCRRPHTPLHVTPYTPHLRRIIDATIAEVDRLLVQYGHDGIPFDKYTIP